MLCDYSVSYRALWNAFKLIAQRLQLSDHNKAAIFHDTAVRVYRLEQGGATASSL